MYIIAEIGSNCFKSKNNVENLNNALSQIVRAKECGASAVKFQFFTAQDLYGETRPEVKMYEMPADWLPALKARCNAADIDFMCSAFSIEGFEQVDKFVEMHKLASPEFCDPTLRDYLFRGDKPVMFSLGCCPVEDNHLWVDSCRKDIDVAMECVSLYPAGISDYNLAPIHDISVKKGLSWGLSDHTLNAGTAIMAQKLGATCFEKHVDLMLDETITPDTCVSISAKQFKSYCSSLRSSQRDFSNDLKRTAKLKYGRILRNGGCYRPMQQE